MGKYDIAMRTIMEGGCATFLAQIGIAVPVQTLPVKLPRVSAREVDFLAEDKDGVVYHVEFQSRNDPTMHARMLAYAALIGEKVMKARKENFATRRGKHADPYHFPEIRQVVVYIGADAPNMQTTIDRGPNLRFRYWVVNALDLDPKALLESPAIGDAVIAVLCKDGAKPDIVRRILGRIDGLEPFRRDEAYGRLLILSELRRASRVIEKERENMNIQVDLNNIESYRRHADDARVAMLVRVITKKFGADAVSQEVLDRLADLSAKDLETLAERTIETGSVDELLEGVPARMPTAGIPGRQ